MEQKDIVFLTKHLPRCNDRKMNEYKCVAVCTNMAINWYDYCRVCRKGSSNNGSGCPILAALQH